MHPLKSHHTFGLNASCNEITTVESLDGLLKTLNELENQSYMFIGEGSNTVFVDDYAGTILVNHLKGISLFEDADFYHLNVASGENWHEFVVYCTERGIHGFENLALIPGTVGAAPIQNIGAYGIEVETFIHSVEFLDVATNMLGYFNKKECQFAYRDSVFKKDRQGERIILAVNFAIPKHNITVASYGPLLQLNEPTPLDIFNTVVKTRKEKLPDPQIMGNAGSFFKNPVIALHHYLRIQNDYPDIPCYPAESGNVKVPAAWLIDTLGFKGKQLGGIKCHDKQALVLVNLSQGSGRDLLTLAREIKSAVAESFDIMLDNEVRLIGRDGLVSL